jgi:hypothetical protein
MKVLVLYRPRSEHRSAVEEFIRQYKGQYPDSAIEALDVDQGDGAVMASLYDVMSYPEVLVVRDDGSVLQSWAGEDSLPPPGDVNYFASSQV